MKTEFMFCSLQVKLPLVKKTSVCLCGSMLALIHVDNNYGLNYYNNSNEPIARNRQGNVEKI